VQRKTHDFCVCLLHLVRHHYAKRMMQARDNIGINKSRRIGVDRDLARQKRRERMKAVSDEALIDLDDYTMILAANGNENLAADCTCIRSEA
jgi:hypothetical protein